MNVLLKINFENGGCIYANCLLGFQTIYLKCLLLQFLGRGIRIHIQILTLDENERFSSLRNSHILVKKCSFFTLISKMKVTCMVIVCVIFSLFIENTFFSISEVVTCLCTFLSWQGFKMDKSVAEKVVIFWNKCTFWCLISKGKVTVMPTAYFIILSLLIFKCWYTYSHSKFAKKCSFKAYIRRWNTLVCQLLVLNSDYLP